MFTGIIEAIGSLVRLDNKGAGYAVEVRTPDDFKLSSRVKVGDSIANNGVCLTACAVDGDTFLADVSAETVELTCFKYYRRGQKLNLELACTPISRLGGHIVQGHVDGVGEVVSVKSRSEAFDVWVKAPSALLPYIALKGSIAVDGVSLTVNELADDAFRLTLIPHTQSGVCFENWTEGAKVNLEADVMARYLERLVMAKWESQKSPEKSGGITMDFLRQNGFF